MLKRIRAIYIENSKPQSEQLVVIAHVDMNSTISDGEICGYVSDDGWRYPFVGQPVGSDFVRGKI